MNQKPDISVIMSVFNGEDYLEEALKSIIAQSFKFWELIAVNDCSSDGTADILLKYANLDPRIKLITNEKNLKLPSSLNKALVAAQGKYIARMDSDDICLPDRLLKQFEYMETHPDTDISSCRFMTLKNDKAASGGGGGKTDFESVKALLLLTNPILHPGVMAKSSVLKNLRYDASLTCTEDLELWARAASSGCKIAIQNEYLMLYRIHDKQITSTTLNRQYKEVSEIFKKIYPEFSRALEGSLFDFYIGGIYFKDKADIKKLCKVYSVFCKVNSKAGYVKRKALRYAFFEILAEYKRCGVSTSDIIRGMIHIGITQSFAELLFRKSRAEKDGKRCINAAAKIGYDFSGGSVRFPNFIKKKEAKIK